ncbi:MAG: DUF2110 family protein [Salinarchaeum sp.]
MVTLASKLYVEGEARDRAQTSLAGTIDSLLADLEVTTTVDIRADDFPSISVEGPDATAAENLLASEFGALPTTLAAGETYTGTLATWDEEGLTLDVGEGRRVQIPTAGLGLGPGTPTQLRTRFGLVQHLPMQFVYGDPPELADAERDRLYEWRRGGGRVNVNSATRSEVRATINRAGHAHDIVTVERLGVLEQSVICREGTDPPGLIAAIGEYLPSELLAVVS